MDIPSELNTKQLFFVRTKSSAEFLLTFLIRKLRPKNRKVVLLTRPFFFVVVVVFFLSRSLSISPLLFGGRSTTTSLEAHTACCMRIASRNA